MPKRKSLKDLKTEEQKIKERLNREKQRLQALKRKIQEEYRKREARFLIAIGRSLLKYGKLENVNGELMMVIPLRNPAIQEAFKEYSDIVSENNDFRKWVKD